MKSTMAKGLRVIAVGLPLAAAAAMPASCVNVEQRRGADAGSFTFDAATETPAAAPAEARAAAPGAARAAARRAPAVAAAATAGSCGSGFVSNGGVCYVNLQGNWSPTSDSNSNSPDTVGTLGTNTHDVRLGRPVAHRARAARTAGATGIHLQIPLGKTFQCASTTLAFDWATTTTQTSQRTARPSTSASAPGRATPIEDGGGPTFYGGPQYVGGAFAGQSESCGYEFENDAGTASVNSFPASAVMAASNTFPLSTYVAPASQDDCTGSFDTIDVHMQVYNCFSTETGTDTLSNLRRNCTRRHLGAAASSPSAGSRASARSAARECPRRRSA